MKKFLFLLALLTHFFMPAAQAGGTLILNTGSSPPLFTPQHDGMVDMLYKALAKRTGLTIEIQFLPAERALLNANSGIEDGDAFRIAGLEKQYPNLVQVPEELMLNKWVVFAKNHRFKVTGVDSLRPYRVGILIGRKILEKNIVGVKSVEKFPSDEAMFDALEKDQIDVLVIEKAQGLALIKPMSKIIALQPALFEGSNYLYLHKKHNALVPIFVEELRKMKQDGSYSRIMSEAMQHHLPGSEY